MGMLPAEFFTNEVGCLLIALVLAITIVFSVVPWRDRHSASLRRWDQEQRRIKLYAYAARLQARTRSTPEDVQ